MLEVRGGILKRHVFLLTFIMLSIFMIVGCNETAVYEESVTPAIYRKISAAEAYEMMAIETEFIILDVRSIEEYHEKRLDGAVLIPDYEILDRAELELSDKNAFILVYCGSGRRSEKAATELVKLGYTNVYDFGGINDWPYEVVSS